MRFDDSLRTVLQAETSSAAGAQAAWRQLVDLIGRGRVAADAAALARLRALRPDVPGPVRAASARALAFATPPAGLVALFGEDDLDIAAPVLRAATLDGAEWRAILLVLSPAGRSVLRHRRDLPAEAVRGLEAFGATDFVLPAATPVVEDSGEDLPVEPAPAPDPSNRSEIADLVARIDAFNRTRERPMAAIVAPAPTIPAEAFRFETDSTATIRWVEGVARGPLVGLALASSAPQGLAQVEGGIAGACRRRSAFRDARLVVGGASDAAGDWRLAGLPAFDPASGRFLGYRGTGRRPRADESAVPVRARASSESLRQIVHELRTPTNAIAGFAELIGTELFGPVPEPYLAHAAAIRKRTGAVVAAIEDVDTAARIDGGALEVRPEPVALEPLLRQTLADLAPLAALRGATVTLLTDAGEAQVLADAHMLDRLVARLLATVIAAAGQGEQLTLAVAGAAESVTLVVDRPAALDAAHGAGDGAAGEGASLLGTAFALRLAGRLAAEIGGALVTGADRLTLRLPAAVDRDMGQASSN